MQKDITTSTEEETKVEMPVPNEEQTPPTEDIDIKDSAEEKVATPEKEVVDITMISPKKSFRINGDNSKIIELNPSDVNVIIRAKEVYTKLNSLAQRAGALLVDKEEATTEKGLKKVADALEQLDKEMRDMIDYMFDSPVSAVLAKDMNMYSPVNGEFWFEHCIEVLSNLYENNFNSEFRKMKTKIDKHTSKFLG